MHTLEATPAYKSRPVCGFGFSHTLGHGSVHLQNTVTLTLGLVTARCMLLGASSSSVHLLLCFFISSSVLLHVFFGASSSVLLHDTMTLTTLGLPHPQDSTTLTTFGDGLAHPQNSITLTTFAP